ncbi:MAG: HIT family protein [Candidatus Saccharibacteria bacterium]|nr:HIT family protein [Candidatus Saccharibacteria bacterium]
MSTIFDMIVSGEIPSFKIYEDDHHLAFLGIFPNTPGHSIVIPKKNLGDDVFSLSDQDYQALMGAAKIVAKMTKKAFGIERVGLMVDGTGVPYAHVRLMPFHGYGDGQDLPQLEPVFYENYPGFVTSKDGPRMDDKDLEEIRKKIAEAEV